MRSADNCNFQHGMDNVSENLNDKKNHFVAKAHHGDAHVVRIFIFSIVIINFHATIYIIDLFSLYKIHMDIARLCSFYENILLNLSTVGQVKSKVSVPETYHGLHKLDSTTGGNEPQRCISSTVIISPEKLGCNQCIVENQHHKVEMLTFSFKFPSLFSINAVI